MDKILLIIRKEYLNKVRKRSFLIMSILSPILLTALWIVPVLLATNVVSVDDKKVGVIDESGFFVGKLGNKPSLQVDYLNESLADAKNAIDEEKYDAVLFIPSFKLDSEPTEIKLYANEEQGAIVTNQLEEQINNIIEKNRFVLFGLNKKQVELLDSRVQLQTITLDESDKEVKLNQDVMMGLGYAAAFLVYFIIFLYGVQVMKSVTEEKSNKIVEIIISSVKPIHLMLGKIIGIAGVVLTQLVIWGLVYAVVSASFNAFMGAEATGTGMFSEMLTALKAYGSQFDLGQFIFLFSLYLIGGFLLYSAFFATIGAVVNNDSDTQQFIMPVSLPLIVGLLSISYVIQAPNSMISFWLSIFPMTSPIVMAARLSFGVPLWELLLSLFLLFSTFISFSWFAGKLFRVALLNQGGKTSIRNLIKLLRIG